MAYIDDDKLRRAFAAFRKGDFLGGVDILGGVPCIECGGTTRIRTPDFEGVEALDGTSYAGDMHGVGLYNYEPCNHCFGGYVFEYIVSPTVEVPTVEVPTIVDPPNGEWVDTSALWPDDVSIWGDPGHCPECGQAFQIVRPGKSQPVCDCHENCPCGGRITYHPPEDSKYTGISGYFCDRCGPFGDSIDGGEAE